LEFYFKTAEIGMALSILLVLDPHILYSNSSTMENELSFAEVNVNEVLLTTDQALKLFSEKYACLFD
jgi:hypothetical protein